jgi:hypothetical protein
VENVWSASPVHERPAEIMLTIDAANILAAYDYQSRHIDVTVCKIEEARASPRVIMAALISARTRMIIWSGSQPMAFNSCRDSIDD